MRYLSKIGSFLKRKKEFLVENVNYHKTKISNLGKIEMPDPGVGDLKLSVMPFENNGQWVSLPEGFKLWEDSFNKILKYIPLQEGANTHYVTIDTKFFTQKEFLRREGVHIDGNFCVDPYFFSSILDKPVLEKSWGGTSFNKEAWGGARFKDAEDTEDTTIAPSDGMKSSWGGASPKTSWGGAAHNKLKRKGKNNERPLSLENIKFKFVDKGNGIHKLIRETKFEELPNNGHVSMDWVLPYDLNIPISEYISSDKGGILTVSTEVGCQAWGGEFYGEILSEGAFDKMTDQLTDDKKVIFEKNQLYFMSSNTPHETLLIDKGKRRTFLRITLNHNYLNENIKGVK